MIIAEFSLPAESFALGETLARFPDTVVEADRIAAHVPGSTLPCIWTNAGDIEEFSVALAADPTVSEVNATAVFDGEQLHHLTWTDEINSLVTEMIDHQGVILEASARMNSWRLRIRFMARDQFDDFRSHFTESNVPFTLERLLEAKHPRHTRGDVTTAQHEALTAAVERGYFQIPRKASIRDVADALDVSHQTVSERLRRGTENLVRDMLFVEPLQER